MDPEAPERKRMFALMESLTIAKIMADTDALLAFAAKDPAAAKGKIGTVGYCMSGQYAINAAAHIPDRVAAAASIYGVRLITEKPDSPTWSRRKRRPNSTSPAPKPTAGCPSTKSTRSNAR